MCPVELTILGPRRRAVSLLEVIPPESPPALCATGVKRLAIGVRPAEWGQCPVLKLAGEGAHDEDLALALELVDHGCQLDSVGDQLHQVLLPHALGVVPLCVRPDVLPQVGLGAEHDLGLNVSPSSNRVLTS